MQKIIRFTPRIENTVRNFIPANDLITAWALEKTSGKNEAGEWLNKQVLHHPDNKSLLWVRAVFGGHKNDLEENEKDASVRVLEQVEGL